MIKGIIHHKRNKISLSLLLAFSFINPASVAVRTQAAEQSLQPTQALPAQTDSGWVPSKVEDIKDLLIKAEATAREREVKSRNSSFSEYHCVCPDKSEICDITENYNGVSITHRIKVGPDQELETKVCSNSGPFTAETPLTSNSIATDNRTTSHPATNNGVTKNCEDGLDILYPLHYGTDPKDKKGKFFWVAIHEICHALIAECYSKESVRDIQIGDRLICSAGQTTFHPFLNGIKPFSDEADLEIDLAGRIGEGIAYSKIYGGENIMKKSLIIINNRSKEEQPGQPVYGKPSDHPNSRDDYRRGGDFILARERADKIAKQSGRSTKEILEKAFNSADSIIREYWTVVERIAEELARKKYMTGKDFRNKTGPLTPK